jgi:retron-type reverse transcriptase
MEEGTPQGGSASPLLANIYLHYVFDLWAQAWRRKQARGDVIVVRYADGTPVQISNLRGASPLIPIVRSGI